MRALLIVALMAGFGTAPAAAADFQEDQDRAREEMLEGKILSYAEIMRIAQRAVPGRVVGQELRKAGRDRYVYALKILQEDGKVASVLVDAHSGRVLSIRGRR